MPTPSAGHLTKPRNNHIDPRNVPILATGSWHRPDFIYPDAPAHLSDRGRRAYNNHRRNYEASSSTWLAGAKDAWFVKLLMYTGDASDSVERASPGNHPVLRQVLRGPSCTWAHVVFLKEHYKSRGRPMSSQVLLRTLCAMYPGAPADFGTNEWSDKYLVAPDGTRSILLGGGSQHGNDSKDAQGRRLDFKRFYADFSLPGGLLRPGGKRPPEFSSSPHSHSEGSKRIKIENTPSADLSLLAQGLSPDIRPTIESSPVPNDAVEGGPFPDSHAGGTAQMCLPPLASAARTGQSQHAAPKFHVSQCVPKYESRTAFTGPSSHHSGDSSDSKTPLSPTSAKRGLKIYQELYAAETRRSRAMQEANDIWRDEVCRLLEDAFGTQRENGREKA